MKEKRECQVIQDLLPNYIEKLTNEETNAFIEEHLKDCKECTSVLNKMKKSLQVDFEKINTKGIIFIKKYNKQLKLFRNLLLLVIATYMIIVGYRFAILTKIENKTTEYIAKTQNINNLTNYHSISRSYKEDQIMIIETYLKDNKQLSTINIYNPEDMNLTTRIISYNGENESFLITETGNDKNINFNNNYKSNAYYSYTRYNYVFERLYIALTTNIHKVNLKGKECYLLKERRY